jgi:hypothetical protein
MKNSLLGFLIFFQSCQYLPEVSKAIEDIETDNAIKIEIQKEGLQKDSNVTINVTIQNRDVKQP